MSGGYFDYEQFAMSPIADSIQSEVDKNDLEGTDEWGSPLGRGYFPETIAEFKTGIDLLRRAFVYAHRIDWLLSGDDGESCFHHRLKLDLGRLEPSKLDLVDDMMEVVKLVRKIYDLGNTDEGFGEWQETQDELRGKVVALMKRMEVA